MDFEAASVSELVLSIKSHLEEEFQEVFIQGEVSNLSPSAAGHWYFTLSDDAASISCALFKMDALRNPLIKNLKDGDKIAILGPVSIYPKRGSFQILGKKILPAGEGQLKLQYERLKNQLTQEGLFDIEKKRAIPKFPKKIAVITAEHGAALQDFLNVIKRRSLWLDIVIIPATVQGEQAHFSLIKGLENAQKINADVIVLTRGGGSLEDLWCFNHEHLVRAISKCQIPVVSAVGHEVDYTLCDYASDYRCETPTAAAELLSQAQTELKGRLKYCESRLKADLFKSFQHIQLLTQKLHPKELIQVVLRKIDKSKQKLESIRLTEKSKDLLKLNETSQELDEYMMRLEHCLTLRMLEKKEKLNQLKGVVDALNPHNVLTRGYSFVEVENKVVSNTKTFKKLEKGTRLKIHFSDGFDFVLKE